MSTKSAPFYWLECDAEGCIERSPNGYSDFVAFQEADQAREDADCSEWTLDHNDTGKDYCSEHTPRGCDCDMLEQPGSAPVCNEFRPTPNNPAFCGICQHVEECHS